MQAIGPAAIELTPMITSLMLVIMRVGAVLMATPIFRSTGMPARVRLALTLLLSVLAVIMLPPDYQAPKLSAGIVSLAASEIALGLAMGLILQLVFAALTIAGEAAAMGMGLGFSTMVDPQRGTPAPTLGQMFVLVATLLFLVLGGHQEMLRMLSLSFELIPPGSQLFSSAQTGVLLDWAARMYSNALFIALPVLVAMLLTNITFGVITRSTPQLNIFAIGFPMMLLLGLAILYVHVDHLVSGTTGLLQEAFLRIDNLIATS